MKESLFCREDASRARQRSNRKKEHPTKSPWFIHSSSKRSAKQLFLQPVALVSLMPGTSRIEPSSSNAINFVVTRGKRSKLLRFSSTVLKKGRVKIRAGGEKKKE
jgi:hypothetical protein